MALTLGGLGAVTVGSILLTSSLVSTPIEKIHGELQRPPPPFTVGVVPTRGGAMLGIGAAF